MTPPANIEAALARATADLSEIRERIAKLQTLVEFIASATVSS
jgi:hypothetical protein